MKWTTRAPGRYPHPPRRPDHTTSPPFSEMSRRWMKSGVATLYRKLSMDDDRRSSKLTTDNPQGRVTILLKQWYPYLS